MVAVFDVDELSGDSQTASRFADAPLQHGADIELLSDLAYVHLFPPKSERRGASRHANTLDLGEGIDEFLGAPVAALSRPGIAPTAAPPANPARRQATSASGAGVEGVR
jgi:hypothetical protein